MVETINKLISKKYVIILFLIISVLTIKGIKGYWSDFKEYIVTSELQERGFIISKEETSIVESSVSEEKDLKKEEKQLKNDIKKIKGITFSDSDITDIKTNKLLSKYK